MREVDGATVYDHLQRELSVVRESTSRLQDDLGRLDAEIEELVDRRGDALADLAREFLPELTQQDVEKTLAEVREELRGVLASKQRRSEELISKTAESETTCRQLEADLASLTKKLDELTAVRESQETQVAEQLEGDEKFQELSQEVLHAEQRLARDEARVEDIKSEAAEKLPSYERSRLFRYLLDRHYGTREYASRGLTRRLDGWVARVIDYGKARQGYLFLQTMPELMTIEAARRREEFEALMQEVESIEDDVADEVGLTETLREVQRYGDQREHAVAAAEQEKERLSQWRAELQSLRKSRGDFYEQAIGRLTSHLQATEAALLERHAKATPQAEDDRLVSELTSLSAALESARSRVAELSREYDKAQDAGRALDDIVTRFRSRGFDSARSYFAAGFDPLDYVHRFCDGEITRTALWSRLSRNQRFRRPPVQTASIGGGPTDSGVGPALVGAMVQVVGPALAELASHALKRRGSAGQRRRVDHGRPRTDWTKLF